MSHQVLDKREVELQVEVLKLRRRIRILTAIVGLLLALIRALGAKLNGERLLEGKARDHVLGAVERGRRPAARLVLRQLPQHRGPTLGIPRADA